MLLQKKKEMQALQRQVNKKQYECDQRLTVVKQREVMLGQKQTKIQEAIKRFDKFIQENDIKRNKAARKEKEERQERMIKEEEAAGLTGQLRDLQVLGCTCCGSPATRFTWLVCDREIPH